MSEEVERKRRVMPAGWAPVPARPAIDRVLERVEYDTNGGCWLWPGATGGQYGHVGLPDRSTVAVHRVTYEAQRGEIPAGLHVLHKCDVKLCCNPAHLFLGTRSENIADAVAKGRLKARGRTKRKLPHGLREVILSAVQPGVRGAGVNAIAKQHGIDPATVHRWMKEATQ